MEKKEEKKGKKEETRKIFISHRHADRKIADAIKETIEKWRFKPISIFQSSDPNISTTIGAPLSDNLKEKLVEADVVLLIYTFDDKDWSYCMWECGVATDPKRAQHPRIVVFQCTDDSPAPFKDTVRVKITEDGILRFTKQFYTEPEFFPGFDEAIAPDIGEEALKDISTTLYDSLNKVVSTKKIKSQRRYRWDSLTLLLESTHVKKLEAEENMDAASKLAADIISKNCVVKNAYGDAFKHFGFSDFEEGKKIGELFARWEQKAGDKPKKEWQSYLYTEMWRAIRNASAEPSWALLKSVRPDFDRWYYPVVNRVTILPDNSMGFDVFLYRAPQDKIETVLSKKKTAT